METIPNNESNTEVAQAEFAQREPEFLRLIDEAATAQDLYNAVNEGMVKLDDDYVLFDYEGNSVSQRALFSVMDKIRDEHIDAIRVQAEFDTVCSSAAFLPLRNKVAQLADAYGNPMWSN